MNRIAPAIRIIDDPASGPPASTVHSSQPIGSINASEPPNTQLIDKSCSSIASAAPPSRARLAAIAERMPPSTGPAILIRVQIAATAITPAPKKRTSARNTVFASVSASPVPPCVRIGSSTHQPVTIPTSCAMPTDKPTRWPTPNNAKASPPAIPVAPLPTANQRATSAPASFIWVSSVNPAATIEFHINADSPARFSSAAFGIGKIRIDNERTAQRHREKHAQYAAKHRDRGRLDHREALPVTDHDQTRQHENDRRQRARGARDRLDDIILEDRRPGHIAQQRHRNHRRWNRGRKGQPDLQPQIDVRRGEHQREHAAEQDCADRQFAPARRCCANFGHKCLPARCVAIRRAQRKSKMGASQKATNRSRFDASIQ